MKILVVTHYMPPHQGGIEHVADALVSGFLDAGLEVRWIASRVPDIAPAEDGVRVRVPSWNGPERMLGVPVPIWGPAGLRRLAHLVRWADAVHVHDCLYPGTAMAVALAQRAGTPVLLSQHVGFVRYAASALNWVQHAAYASLGRAVLRRASRIVFATPAAVQYVTALLGGRPATARDIPNGIDISRFHPRTPSARRAGRARLGLSADGPLVLFAGRLVPKKGVDLLLDVARELPDARFVVVGDGPLRSLLRAPGGNVVWIPAVPNHDMPSCYDACDAVVMPSRDEGLPLVVQEAMAAGCPVIVPEDETYAVDLRRAAVCACAPRSTAAFAREIRRLIADGDHGLGARARAWAEAHWDRKRMVDRYIAVLEEITPARRVA